MKPNVPDDASSPWLRRSLWVILGAALLLRFWNLDSGLPQIHTTDEWFEVKRALKLGAGVFDFDRVGKGFYYYLLFVVFGLFYAVQRVLGMVGGANDFLLSIFRDPTGLWMTGRSTTAVIGGINVWLIYLAGSALRSRAVGLVAAVFLAIHMMHVRASHAITVDVPLVTLLTLGFLLVHRWQDRDDLTMRHYAALGLVTALATATKLPGAVLVICVAVFYVQHATTRGRAAVLRSPLDRRLWVYVLVGAVCYTAIEPGIVYKIGDILRMLASFFTPRGAVDVNPSQLPIAPGRLEDLPALYAGALFPAAYTILPLLFLAGAFVAIRRNGLLRQPTLFFALIFAAFLLTSKSDHLIYARYVLPLAPVVFLYAAVALVTLHGSLKPRFAWGRLVAPALALVVWIPMLVDTVRLDIDFGRPDTRTLAKQWIEANIPEGAPIYIAGSLVRPSSLTAQLKMVPGRVDEKVGTTLVGKGDAMSSEKSQYYEVMKQALAEYHPTYDLILLDDGWDLGRALAEDRGEWAVMLDVARATFDHEPNRVSFPERWELFHRIDEGEFEVVRRFKRERGQIGPDLTVYRKKISPEAEP